MTHIITEDTLLHQQRDEQKELMEAAAFRVCDKHGATVKALIHWIELHGMLAEWQQEVANVGRERNISEEILEGICGPKGDWK